MNRAEPVLAGSSKRSLACLALSVGLVCWLGARPAAAESKRKIAVLELTARGLSDDLAKSITDLVAREVDRSGLFTTISTDDVRAMLQHEENKMMLGCNDEACLAEIGGALGVELLLSGSVGKIGETFVVSLKLIDVRRAAVVSREERTVQGKADDLVSTSREAVKVLLRPLMKKAQGTLALACEEEGAEVYVDDLMIGTTPLEPRKLPGGYHALRIKKPSFVVFARDVLIEPDQATEVLVSLVPSRAFLEQYESRATTYRTLAWTLTGIAIAAAGTASGLLVWNEGRLGDYQQDRKAFLEGQDIDPEALNARAESINLVDSVTWAVGGLGLAALGAGLYFWFAGDPPGKYDRFQTEAQVQAAWLWLPMVSSDGLGVSSVLRF
jgi:TolB-like protein